MSMIYEPEYEETVEQDTVLVFIDGKWVDVTEVTNNDPEGKQFQ